MRAIAAVSGGKDSTAMALRLAEMGVEFTPVCTPTGNELPEMIDHWKRLGELLGRPLLPVTVGHSLQGLIRKFEMLPNHTARWCTRILKLEAYYRWLETQMPCISYVGLRADEESRPGMIFPDAEGVDMRFPMREWGWDEAAVFAFLEQRNVRVPARTDCAWCYHQTLGEWWRLWKLHPDIYQEAVEAEEWVSKQRGKTFTFRNPLRDNWPAGLRELREWFEAGHIPPRTVTQEDIFLGGVRRKTMRSGSCRMCSL